MKENILIKSYQNGISLMLEEDCTFEEILSEVEAKFTETRAFFKDARMALSMEGRKLSDSEQMQIIEVIRRCSDLRIVCLVGKDEDREQFYLKALERMDRYLGKQESEGQFYKGTLKNRQVIETEQSIVILGDVNPGSAVISAHDIIVLGGLYGEAYAGANGEENHYIVALEMAPERLKIGDLKYISSKPAKWGIKPKMQPQIAFIKNEKLVVQSLTKELLSAF